MKADKVIVNRRAGKCQACRAQVAAGEGFAVLSGNWVVYHNSTQCLPADVQAQVRETAEPQTRVLTAEGIMYTPREPQNLPLVRSFPGARFRKPDDGREPSVTAPGWQVSLSPADRARVLEIADQLKLDVAPELRTWARPAVVARQMDAAKAAGAYPFQVEGVEFITLRNVAMLFDDMGLGKTVQALLAAPEQRAGFGLLAVVPASLKYNWAKECKRWSPHYRPVVLEGRSSFRFPEPGELLICNSEILPKWLEPVEVDGAKSKWDREVRIPDEHQRVLAASTYLIADEIHLYKNYQAARSKRVNGLVRVCAQVLGMTGTPKKGKPFDLWGVLSTFEVAFEVFGSFSNFCRLYNARKNEWGGWDFGLPSPEVAERLRRISLRRTKEEVLPDLPTKTRQDIPVSIAAELCAVLSEIAGEFGAELDEGIMSMPLFERMSEIRALIAKACLPAAMPIIEAYEEAEEPLVVFSAHRDPVLELGQREGWATILGGTPNHRRQEIVEQFQRGELKGLAMTIRAGGVGLTLTAASNMLFIDQDWTPGENFQAEDRICRIGQTADKVLIQRLVPDHPLTARVAELVQWKIDMIQAGVEARVAVEVASPKPAQGGLPAVHDETAAEFEARAAAFRDAELAAERRVAEEKVNSWFERMAEPEPPVALNADVMAACEDALSYMLSVCDGAISEDGAGFNKPDAARMHWVSVMHWRSSPEAQHVLRTTLRGYPRQLRDKFPAIWA